MNHFDAVDFSECHSEEVISFFWRHWRKSGGGVGGGGMYPPTFLGGGMACTNIPPPTLFEDKIWHLL